MQELIKVTVQNDRQLVSARDLYKGLGLKIRFSLWVSQNFEGFEEGKDFTSVFVDTEVENNGGVQVRKLKDYWLTVDMAKELCMMSKTEKGKEVRKYFIQVEKEFKAQKSLQQPDSLVTPKGQKHIISKCLHGKWDDAYQRVMTSTFSI